MIGCPTGQQVRPNSTRLCWDIGTTDTWCVLPSHVGNRPRRHKPLEVIHGISAYPARLTYRDDVVVNESEQVVEHLTCHFFPIDPNTQRAPFVAAH